MASTPSLAYDLSNIDENYRSKNPIRFRAMERASDELLDLVGDDVLRISVEHRMVGPRNLDVPGVWNVLG
jgi:hypothetical protein